MQKAKLLRHEEEQGLALTRSPTGSPPHSVDVLLRLIWRIVLHYPVHLRDVQAARCDVCTKKDSRFGGTKLVERRTSCRLLLVTMYAVHRKVDVVQQLIMELNRIASRHEDHDLLVFVSLQEGEEQQKPGMGRADYIALSQACDRRNVVLGLDFNENRFAEREPGQISHFSCLCSRKQGCLSLLRQHLDNEVHLLLEADLQYSIRFVDDQVHQIMKHETFGVLHVIQ
mmetsp:Transcript_12820/g.30477  ORF Transcript_12820/g.30477 Transcript_12820/m.30477 type:complete len:227 (-) Transcript_12820:1007-1687(-)